MFRNFAELKVNYVQRLISLSIFRIFPTSRMLVLKMFFSRDDRFFSNFKFNYHSYCAVLSCGETMYALVKTGGVRMGVISPIVWTKNHIFFRPSALTVTNKLQKCGTYVLKIIFFPANGRSYASDHWLFVFIVINNSK